MRYMRRYMAVVRKQNPHTLIDKASGRLSYRRVYPPELRKYIAALGHKPTELKRSLKASRLTDPGAAERYRAAEAEWQAIVDQATKLATGTYDKLDAPKIAYLAATFEHDWHAHDERELAERGEEFAEAAWRGWEEMLSEYQRWRIERDFAAMEGRWGSSARALIAHEHIVLAPDDFESLHALCAALNDRAIAMSGPARARLRGEIVPVPDVPAPPNPNTVAHTVSFERLAVAILENPRHPTGASTKQAAMTALRFFREAFGNLPPSRITKAIVSEWLDLLALRPRQLPANRRAVPLRDLVSLYEAVPDVERLAPKTMATLLGAMSALWNKAQKEEGHIADNLPNPFVGRSSLASHRPEDPQELSTAELNAMFALPIFTRRERPKRGRGEASYWLPLLLLWTGARPEELAQLMTTDVFQDPDDPGGRWLLRITDQGVHPVKGRRSLKTTKNESGRRTFPIHPELLRLNFVAFVDHIRASGQTALFPGLTIKGERGLLFAGWGEWWSLYVREKGILPEGNGRRPSREFRHNWNTAARRCQIPQDAREYLLGHVRTGGSANELYGGKGALGDYVDRLAFRGLDLSSVLPWQASTKSL
jgi:integrase